MKLPLFFKKNISPVSNVLLSAATTTSDPIVFATADFDTPDANLSVTVTSSNQAVIASSGITLNNCDSVKSDCQIIVQRTVNQTPGYTTITITVTDSRNLTSQQTFNITVDDFPLISSIPGQVATSSQTLIGPLFFNVTDSNHPGPQLNVTVLSIAPNIIPLSSITIICSIDKLNCSITIALAGAALQATGQTIIIIFASDPLGGTGSSEFLVTILAPTAPCCSSSFGLLCNDQLSCNGYGGTWYSSESCTGFVCPTTSTSGTQTSGTQTTGSASTTAATGNASGGVSGGDGGGGDGDGRTAGIVIGVVLGTLLLLAIIAAVVAGIIFFLKKRGSFMMDQRLN